MPSKVIHFQIQYSDSLIQKEYIFTDLLFCQLKSNLVRFHYNHSIVKRPEEKF